MTFQTYKPNVPKLRGRDLGLPFTGRTGTYNAITDVAGIGVGYRTMIENEPRPGRARPVRTGVTAILPHMFSESPVPVYAGVHRFNGNGEMTGTHWIEDGGYFLGPVVITNTHGVGMAHHATVRWMIDRYASTYQTDDFLWIMPVPPPQLPSCTGPEATLSRAARTSASVIASALISFSAPS